MASVTLTNGIRTNLLALNNTKDQIGATQNKLSTGMAVSSPIDDAFKYFTSKSLSDRANDLSTRKDSIDQAVSVVTTASNALTSTESLLQQMKGIVDSSRSGTASQRASYGSQLQTLTSQIGKLINDASYNGQNLLNSSTANMTVYFSDKASSKLSVQGVNFNVSKLFVLAGGQGLSKLSAAGIAGYTTAAASAANALFAGASTAAKRAATGAKGVGISGSLLLLHLGLFSQKLSGYQLSQATVLAKFNSHADVMQTSLDSTIQKVRAQSAIMGNNVAVLNVRLDFTKNYMDTLQSGSQKLTVADLNTESAKLMSLNTRQSIATSALSMANQADQGVLQLLR